MNLEKMPVEIQMRIFKMTPHPIIEMLNQAQKEYQAYLRRLEYHLDCWRPCPPTEQLREYEDMTLLKYLKQELEKRIRQRKLMANSNWESDSDSVANLNRDPDYDSD